MTLLGVVAAALEEGVRRQRVLVDEVMALRGELERVSEALAAVRGRAAEAEAGRGGGRGRVGDVEVVGAERDVEALQSGRAERREHVAAPGASPTVGRQAGESSGASTGGVVVPPWERPRLDGLPSFVEAALRSMKLATGLRVSPTRMRRPGAKRSGTRSSGLCGVTSPGRCALGTLGARGPPGRGGGRGAPSR